MGDSADEKKKKVGYTIPVAFKRRMDLLAKRLGGKEKWLAVSAAILMYFDADEQTRNRYIVCVKTADLPGGDGFEELASRGCVKGDGGRIGQAEAKPLSVKVKERGGKSKPV